MTTMVGDGGGVSLSPRADDRLGEDQGTARHGRIEGAAHARGDHERMLEPLEQRRKAGGKNACGETDGGEAKTSIPEGGEGEGLEAGQPKRPGERPGLELNRRQDEDRAQAGRPRRPPP